MIIKRQYIIWSLVAYGSVKSLIAILSFYAYSSGKVSYLLNETIILGVLGVLLIVGALNIKHMWGKALSALFFLYMAIKQLALLLAGFGIQGLIILIEGREVVGSPYWYINILLITVYSFIVIGLWLSKEQHS